MSLRALAAMALVGSAVGVFDPDVMRVCNVDADCQLDGDTTATCNPESAAGTIATDIAGMCKCTATTPATTKKITKSDLVGLPAGAQTINLCVQSTEDLDPTSYARHIDVLILMTWYEAPCSVIPEIADEFFTASRVVLNRYNSGFELTSITNITHTCAGLQTNTSSSIIKNMGVNTAIRAKLTAADIFDERIVLFMDNLIKKMDTGKLPLLQNLYKHERVISEKAAVRFCPLQTGSLIIAPFSPVNHFSRTFNNPEDCRAVLCANGYFNSNGVCTLTTPTPPVTDDDIADLEPGTFIAIVACSGFVFLCVLIIIIYCCCKCCKSTEEEPTNGPDSESSSSSSDKKDKKDKAEI